MNLLLLKQKKTFTAIIKFSVIFPKSENFMDFKWRTAERISCGGIERLTFFQPNIAEHNLPADKARLHRRFWSRNSMQFLSYSELQLDATESATNIAPSHPTKISRINGPLVFIISSHL